MAKEQWKVERAKRIALQAEAFDSLTGDQKDTIKQTYKALRKALNMIHDTQDLYLSDVQRLESAFWAINHNFNCEQWEDIE